MLVLGIESSCDETAIAIVKDGREVLASCVASQVDQHAVFGGVVPEIAAREHLKAIVPLAEQALAESGCGYKDLNLIAVTQGPGLVGALLVGISYAKGLASSLALPLVPVDHVHAHVHGALLGLEAPCQLEELFPCLALVVSGGHSNLYYMEGPTAFRLMAATIDDACGECFDKVAKVLGLPYPGGPAIEGLARQGDPRRFPMPRMVADKNRLAFSYSGLKTHMIYWWQKNKELLAQDPEALAAVCASFQEEALGQLLRKLQKARELCPQPVRSLLVAGGVAANQRFRELIRANMDLQVLFPRQTYCSDNAAMIAAFGWHEYNKRKAHENFYEHNWDAYARYRFESALMNFDQVKTGNLGRLDCE